MSIAETNPRIAYFKGLSDKVLDEISAGATRWLGGTLKEMLPGRLVAEFVVREDMVNPMKTLHGGAAAMIMDEMMGMMVYLLGHPNAHTSVNLNCDFLNPAPVGTRLTATAVVIREGKNIIHCACDLHDGDNRLIAKSSSNLVVTSVPLNEP